MAERLPAQKGLHPTVLLGDGQWERIIRALGKSNAKADRLLGERLDRYVQEARRRHVERLAASSPTAGRDRG